MRKLFFVIGICFIATLFFLPVHAQVGLVSCGSVDNPLTPSIDEARPCGFCDIFQLIKTIVDKIMIFVPIVGALFLAIGGFLFFVGGADPSKVSQANSVIKATIIGLIIIYTSWLFINFFLSFLGVAVFTGPGTWWQITC